MNDAGRPILYYLMKQGNKAVKIEAMTDVNAAERLARGSQWLSYGFKSRAEAEDALKGYPEYKLVD